MKVILNYESNLNFIAKARKFENILLDEPQSFKGDDTGPSPIEYFLIGIGGCLGSTFTYCLKKKKIPLLSLEIEVDGKMKHLPPQMNLRLIGIEILFKYSIGNGDSSDKINYCINEFKKFCPIYESLIKGIPINMNFINLEKS